MELSEVMIKRRSIRSYDSETEISEAQVDEILNAGISAPTAGNVQCWRFVVVRDEKLRKALSIKAGHQKFIGDTPVIIVVCADTSEIVERFGVRGASLYAIQDTAAAIQNMLLKITELGLASCWIGAFDEKQAAEILSLDENIRPLAMLPVGKAKNAELKILPKKLLNEIVIRK